MSDTTQDGSQSEGPLGERDDAGLLAKILETSFVGITVVDAEGQIFFANRKAEEILGLTKSEITGRVYNDPEWRITTFDGGPFPDEELPFQKIRDTGKAVEDVRHAIVWPDGRTVCLSINASHLTDANGGFAGIVAGIEDISAAVEGERALERQSRANQVLTQCNQALIRAADETSLLKEVCRIVVEDGGYRLAWVGYAEEDGGKTVKPVAQCGFEEGYLETITVTWDETDTGQGPTGTAIRTGQPARARNIVSDPTYAPWREQALKRGYASSLALPLIANSHTLGALNIYAAEADAFDPGEEGLLMQMANDLAYGITTLRGREEQKKNLVKLTESESRYRTLVEHAADGIFIIDSRGKYVDANQSGLNMLGYSRDEMLEMHVTDIVSRNDMEQTPIKLDLLLAGETLTTKRELVRKDGSIVPVELSARMMPNGDILGIQRDISVRKLAERELHESREDWRRIFNSISDPVMILDLEQNILAANPATEKKLELSLDRILGRKCYEVFRLLDEAAEGCPFKSLIESGGAVATGEMEMVAVGGTFLVTVAPIFDPEGKLSKVLHIAKDITERKKTENVLKESEARLNEAQRIAYIGSWELDIVNNVLTWSDEMYRMFEIDPNKFGASYEAFLDAIHPEDRKVVNFAYTNSLKTRIPYAIEHRLLFPDGRIKYVHERCETFYDADGKHLRSVGTTQDITERRRAVQALQTITAQLGEAQHLAQIGSWDWDVTTDAINWSDEYYRIYGFEIGSPPPDYIEHLKAYTPESVERLDAAVKNSMEDGTPYSLDLELAKPTATTRWISARGEAKRDSDGKIVGLRGTAQNITERKQSEQALRESQALLHETGKMAHVGGWELDVERRELLWTEEVYRIHEVDMTFKPSVSKAIDFYAPTSKPIIERAVQRAIEHSEPFDLELEVITAKGNFRRVHAIGKADREHSKVMGTFQDITERKQTEDELRLLQTIIMAASEAEDLPSSIGVVLKEVCDTTGWIMGEAWMPSRDGTELECSPVWHAGIKGLDEFRQVSCRFTFPMGVGLPGRVWASREPEWIEDFIKDEKCFRSKYAEPAGIKSGVAIPVLLNDKVIAVLDFFIREPRREDRKLINMVSGVAAQLGSVIARKQARDEVKQYNMLLNAISRTLVKFINDADLSAVFDDLLYRILLLTNSKFGLIGEVRNNADGQPYLCIHATTYITGDQQVENFFKKQGPHFEFHNMDMLVGDAITKGKPVIVNDVPGSPHRGELTEGHPEITSYLGLPFKSGDRVVGLVGIANRQDGYDEEMVSYLEPLLITCTSIVEAYRNDQLRLQTEKDLVKSYKTLRNTFDGVVSALASTTESRDPYTAGHQERVSRLAAAIAEELGLSKDQIKGMQVAGLLHDLGKMSVPVEILSKPGKINEHELNIIKMHTTVGNDILSSIEFPWPVARIAHQHHERMDGTGYPLGLKGDEISLEARILAVADVVEAMSSHRPYRAAKGINAALDEIAQQSGILYDPDVADACLRLFREKRYELE